MTIRTTSINAMHEWYNGKHQNVYLIREIDGYYFYSFVMMRLDQGVYPDYYFFCQKYYAPEFVKNIFFEIRQGTI